MTPRTRSCSGSPPCTRRSQASKTLQSSSGCAKASVVGKATTSDLLPCAPLPGSMSGATLPDSLTFHKRLAGAGPGERPEPAAAPRASLPGLHDHLERLLLRGVAEGVV